MEPRKVTIINSRTQSQKTIQDSTASTLGELKSEMRERDIDYEGMTFYEGHLRAELKDDASILPTNIQYRGQTVNDLTFMLTSPEKKIKSGAYSRAELITEAKKLGFGGNPTQTKSSVLLDFIEGTRVKEETVAPAPVVVPNNCKAAIEALLDLLYDEDILCSGQVERIKDILFEGVEEDTTEEASADPEKMSKAEIDDMFGDWTRN